MNQIEVVELTPNEQALFDSIQWEGDDWLRWEHEERIEMLENMKRLAESLVQRNAVTQVRLNYFLLPEFHLGGRGKSRKQVFEKNGTTGTDIFRHPHFMKYLWYFINGPRLPQNTIVEFCRIIDEDRGTSGMVLDQICAFVRKEVRDQRLPYDSPDEFAKLAFEIDRTQLADSVRKAASNARR